MTDDNDDNRESSESFSEEIGIKSKGRKNFAIYFPRVRVRARMCAD